MNISVRWFTTLYANFVVFWSIKNVHKAVVSHPRLLYLRSLHISLFYINRFLFNLLVDKVVLNEWLDSFWSIGLQALGYFSSDFGLTNLAVIICLQPSIFLSLYFRIFLIGFCWIRYQLSVFKN